MMAICTSRSPPDPRTILDDFIAVTFTVSPELQDAVMASFAESEAAVDASDRHCEEALLTKQSRKAARRTTFAPLVAVFLWIATGTTRALAMTTEGGTLAMTM